MKKVVKAGSIELLGRQLTLSRSAKGKGHYLEILESIVTQVDAMLSYHCKVLIIRVDLHLDVFAPDNRELTALIRRLRKSLKAKGVNRLSYVWCREVGASKNLIFI